VHHVARDGHRDEDHHVVPAAHRLALGCEGRYFEPLDQGIIRFLSCHSTSDFTRKGNNNPPSGRGRRPLFRFIRPKNRRRTPPNDGMRPPARPPPRPTSSPALGLQPRIRLSLARVRTLPSQNPSAKGTPSTTVPSRMSHPTTLPTSDGTPSSVVRIASSAAA